jgi:CubicO group peptidase (beta-lactamase class C family)
MYRLTLLRLIVFVWLTLGLAPARAETPVHTRLDAALDQVRAMVAASPDAWGLSVTVTDREKTLMIATHGYADIDRRMPVTAETRFAIGSISKSFAAIALMQMADEGRFDPDAPIERYLPDFHPHSAFPPITGRSLLTHSSGLPNYLTDVASMRYLVAALDKIEPGYAPGDHFWYSNSGYQLLGYVAEHIDGLPYPLILQRRVLDRLGMTATSPQIDQRLRAAMPKSYVRAADGSRQEAPWFPYLAADGGIVSTAADMSRYARMLLARGVTPNGRLISAAAFDRFATPVLAGYGYGIEVLDHGRVLAHSGSIAGFQAYLNADLGRGFAVIFLANGPIDKTLRDRIVARLTKAAGGEPREAAKPPPPFAEPASFAGKFACGDGGDLTFEAVGPDDLALRQGGALLPLTRLARNIWAAYLTPRGPRAFVFFRDESGTVTDVSEGVASCAKAAPAQLAPKAWRALAGRYMAHGEEGPGLRIFARHRQLMMAYADTNAPPIPLIEDGPGHFRFAEPDWAPERLVFDTVIGGKAQRLTLSGVPLYRIDLP